MDHVSAELLCYLLIWQSRHCRAWFHGLYTNNVFAIPSTLASYASGIFINGAHLLGVGAPLSPLLQYGNPRPPASQPPPCLLLMGSNMLQRPNIASTMLASWLHALLKITLFRSHCHLVQNSMAELEPGMSTKIRVVSSVGSACLAFGCIALQGKHHWSMHRRRSLPGSRG